MVCPPSWIFKNLISEHWVPLDCRFSITIPNLAQKCWSTSKLMSDIEIQVGFVTSSYRTTHEVRSLGCIGLSNFMLIRCIVLEIWRFEFFADLAWNAYSRPQNFVFLGVLTPKRDWASSRPPKCTSWLEPRSRSDFGGDRSSGATWARDEGTKQGEERNLLWQTGCSPRPPTLTQRYVVLHAGWSSGGSYKFQVSSKSVERFSRCGWSKIAISYT